MSSLLQGESRDEDHLYTDNYAFDWDLQDDDHDTLSWLTGNGSSQQGGTVAEQMQQHDQRQQQQQQYPRETCSKKEAEMLFMYLKFLHENGIITLDSDAASSLNPKHPSLDVRGFTVNPTVPDGMFFAGYLAQFVLNKHNPERFKACLDKMCAMKQAQDTVSFPNKVCCSFITYATLLLLLLMPVHVHLTKFFCANAGTGAKNIQTSWHSWILPGEKHMS